MAWQRVLEDSRVMRSYPNKVILIATDGLTKKLCIAAYLFAKQVVRLVRRFGLLCPLFKAMFFIIASMEEIRYQAS